MEYEVYVEFYDVMSMGHCVESWSSNFIELSADTDDDAAAAALERIGANFIRDGRYPDEVRLFRVTEKSELTNSVRLHLDGLREERKKREDQERQKATGLVERLERAAYERLKAKFG